MKHFKLTSESKINISGKTLFRIEATIDFKSIKKGDKGGWIEKEDNLSGNAWVYGNASVFGNAEVYGNAEVHGNVKVFGSAKVFGNALVLGNASVFENAEVYGNVKVFGSAKVYGNASVLANAKVYGNASVSGNALVYGNASVYGNSEVCEDAECNKKVFTSNFVYNLTLTNNHIRYGYIQKTIDEWIEWLESNEVIETRRGTKKFKLIEQSLSLAIEYSKYR